MINISEYINENILCPSLLAFIAFLFDMLINKECKGLVFIYSIITFPKELMLLSLGFSVVVLFNDKNGIYWLLLCLIFTIIVYAISKSSENYLEKQSERSDRFLKKWWPLIIQTFCSLIIAALIYVVSILMCLGGN